MYIINCFSPVILFYVNLTIRSAKKPGREGKMFCLYDILKLNVCSYMMYMVLCIVQCHENQAQ